MEKDKINSINSIKKEFDEILIKGDNFNYDDVIVRLCERLINELGQDISTWPIIKYPSNIIDIYFECLYYYWLINRFKSINFPLQQLVILMSYRPIVYHSISMTKTHKELKEWIGEIREIIYELYGKSNKTNLILKFEELLEISTQPIKNISAITYFHYFIGFRFHKSYIGIDKNKLIEILGKYDSIIHINITYNLEGYKDNVFVYSEMSDVIGNKFLDPFLVKRFKPIRNVFIDKKPTSMISIEGEIGDINYFVINYNDEIFTLLSKGEELLPFTKIEAERFIDGAIPLQITNEEYLVYGRNIYHNSLNKIISSVDLSEEDKKVLPNHGKIFIEKIQPHLDYYVENYKINMDIFHKMISDIEKDIDSNDLHEDEKKIFIFYIDMYTFEEFNRNEFISYIMGYFNPEMLK